MTSVIPAGTRTVLVHDYLTQFGGAEQVLAVLQGMFPDAPTLTTLHNPDVNLPGLDRTRIIESPLGRVPGLRRYHRFGLPAFPLAMRALGRSVTANDVVVADSSAWAHQISVPAETPVVAYCHSPARFLYGDNDYLTATSIDGLARSVLRLGTTPLRMLDRRAWSRADVILANSDLVRKRLMDQIGIEARVLHPPIDIARYQPVEPVKAEDWFLVLSRLVPHKRIDLVIETCNHLRVPLRIIGTGRDLPRLQALAGPTIRFMGFLPEDEVILALQQCRALIIPGVEDFGMTAVEAQAAGRPVITIDRGGTAEAVVPDVTGILFHDQTVAGLSPAIERTVRDTFDSADAIRNAARFDTAIFAKGIRAAVDEAIQLRRLARKTDRAAAAKR